MLKKKLFLSAVLLILALSALILSRYRPKKAINQVAVLESRQVKPEVLADKPVSESKETLELPDELEQFNLPEAAREKIKSFIENGELDDSAADISLPPEGLKGVSLSLDKKTNNLSAGQKIAPENFDKIFKAGLEALDSQSEQVQSLGSQALLDLAFAAVEASDFIQAETAFKALIKRYPDKQSTQAAYLEYSRILFQQGRLNQARDLLSEAFRVYSQDKEFLLLAKKLEESIDSYE